MLSSTIGPDEFLLGTSSGQIARVLEDGGFEDLSAGLPKDVFVRDLTLASTGTFAATTNGSINSTFQP